MLLKLDLPHMQKEILFRQDLKVSSFFQNLHVGAFDLVRVVRKRSQTCLITLRISIIESDGTVILTC